MENGIQKQQNSELARFKDFIGSDIIKANFEQILGKKAPIFISNLTTIVAQNLDLQKSDYNTVISAALTAASLDLPITPGLGFAAILPYKDYKDGQKLKAQFQVMKKGYIQLGMRSGQISTLNVCEVREGELISCNKFTGEYKFDEAKKKSEIIVGYVAYMKLVNGFEKYNYMTIPELEKHAKKYSQSYKINGKGKWADKSDGGFEQMCEKTVIKLLMSNYSPLSVDIQLQKAVMYDQSVIMENGEPDYVDNQPETSTDNLTNIVNKAKAASQENNNIQQSNSGF
jgi:recombination protein RecT